MCPIDAIIRNLQELLSFIKYCRLVNHSFSVDFHPESHSYGKRWIRVDFCQFTRSGHTEADLYRSLSNPVALPAIHVR